MSTVTLNLTPKVYEYFQENSLREPDVLKKLREQTQKMSMSQMQISPEQGQFMRFLIEILQAKKTLDIGVFTGYSALSVALAMPKDGKIIACDLNDEWTKIARRFWEIAGVSEKIDLRLGPASQTLQNLIDNHESGTFDFAFIDADKQGYLDYYEKTLQLLRVGGVVAIDNVLWGGAVADEDDRDANTEIIRQVNSKLLNDERVTLSMLPIGDGLTLARKR